MLPAKADITTYGAQGKVNGLIPPSDLAVDWSNPLLASGISDIAALGLVSPQAWFKITLAAISGNMTLISWYAQWSNVTTTTPILANVGTGHFTISVPATVNTEYANSVGQNANIAVNFSAADVSIVGTTFGLEAHADASGNVVTIYTASGGTLNNLVNTTVFVKVY